MITGDEIQSFSNGDDVLLNCSANDVSAIQWLFNGMKLMNETSTVLNILNVTEADGGIYTCALNGTIYDNVTVHILPEFISQFGDIQVINGSVSTLVCEATGFPTPTYVFSRVGNSEDRRDNATNSNILLFDPILFGDEGDYYCNATSGEVTIQSIFTITSEKSMQPKHFCVDHCYF